MIRKATIALLLGLSAISASQANEKTDPRHERTDSDVERKIINEVRSAKARADADTALRPQFIRLATRYLNNSDDRTQRLFNRNGFGKRDILQLARSWARDGDAEINFLVGKLYNSGYADIKDKDIEALKWFRVAAAGGQPEAQNILAMVYDEGLWGVEADGPQAIAWYERAAQQGDDEALVGLAAVYYSGRLVRADYARALSLFERAYKNGSMRAATYLGQMYYSGQYVGVDCDKAGHYYEEGGGSADDFVRACRQDERERKKTGAELPVLTLRHESNFIGDETDPYECKIHFVVATNKLGEVANLRVVVELKNDAGTTSEQTLAFPTIGLTTLDGGMNGQTFGSLQESLLLPMRQSDFCQFSELAYRVKAATATINGQETDLLKAGILQ
ncbi:sel1 repeat family protein [Affinibrenneria salicis]|uniref:Sel1 repeat family protein n=1 Tax=Affinibrenneria salicis TaxID=2590031 RepID=A0A5J5G514_9GAMM|nr:tetratricopeptide repeat protein [Affinibrenneria salicis]KAA9001973.1 sel1 repeat family protein [Affinibrenneria salicis]